MRRWVWRVTKYSTYRNYSTIFCMETEYSPISESLAIWMGPTKRIMELGCLALARLTNECSVKLLIIAKRYERLSLFSRDRVKNNCVHSLFFWPGLSSEFPIPQQQQSRRIRAIEHMQSATEPGQCWTQQQSHSGHAENQSKLFESRSGCGLYDSIDSIGRSIDGNGTVSSHECNDTLAPIQSMQKFWSGQRKTGRTKRSLSRMLVACGRRDGTSSRWHSQHWEQQLKRIGRPNESAWR